MRRKVRGLSLLLTTTQRSLVCRTPRYFDKVKSAAVHVVNYKHNVLFPDSHRAAAPSPPPPRPLSPSCVFFSRHEISPFCACREIPPRASLATAPSSVQLSLRLEWNVVNEGGRIDEMRRTLSPSPTNSVLQWLHYILPRLSPI